MPGECPFANLKKINLIQSKTNCPFHSHHIPDQFPLINQEIPLHVVNGTHKISQSTAMLLADIGGGDRIREFCTRFYARAFLDKTLVDFFFEDDGATAHGKRLANWIIQKMGGEGEPWTDSGRWGQRQPSHSKAWHNEKRDPSVRGRHFKLGETRVWMRLHFWAVRECGLAEHTAFWEWYIQFIEHFVSVYESKAPKYAAMDAEWSADQTLTERYESVQHHCMDDIAHLA